MEEKHLKKGLIIYAIWNAMLYFAIVFYKLESNPIAWNEEVRLLFIWIGWLLGIFISILIMLLISNKK